MCIIAIPKLPVIDCTIWHRYIKEMTKNNPDKNGIIFQLTNGDICWQKDVSQDEIEYIIKRYDMKKIYIHCRRASSGDISGSMAHPFLLSPNRDMLLNGGKLLDGEALIMQNGTFPFLPTDRVKSDTAIMCEIIKNYSPKIESAEKLLSLLMSLAPTSKFVVASTNDGIWRTPTFIKTEEGLFSNNTHRVGRIKKLPKKD